MALQSIRQFSFESSTQWKLLDLVELWTQIYSITSLVFFCFVARLVIDHFGIICQKLNAILTMLHHGKQSGDLVNRKLKHLQRQHELLCRSAHSMNEIFGPVLVFQILFVFIGVINSIVNIFFKLKDGLGKTEDYYALMSTLSFLISHFANFSLLCHGSDNLRNAVSYYHKYFSSLFR
jgi:hypothetical protein